MSIYTKRCVICRTVRGNSAFQVRTGGGRADVCRWCVSQQDEHARTLTGLQRQIVAKRKERTALQSRLDQNGMQLAALRSEASSLVTGRITAEAS